MPSQAFSSSDAFVAAFFLATIVLLLVNTWGCPDFVRVYVESGNV